MKMLIVIAVVAICIGLGLLHRRLARMTPVWPGAIVPVLWVGTAGYLIATGRIASVVDAGGLVLVSIVLARIWYEARSKRTARRAPDAAQV